MITINQFSFPQPLGMKTLIDNILIFYNQQEQM
jgi:hypothetical protein